MTEPRGPQPDHQPDHQPDPDLDARLSAMMSDAVSHIEPGEALDSIRNRTKVTPMSARRNSGRPWLYAVVGAVAATAAVITAIAFAGGNFGLTDNGSGPGPAGQSKNSQPTEPTPSETGSASPQPTGITTAAYYLGDTPRGERLYREFTQVPAADDLAAALVALAQTPGDPDYATSWQADQLLSASYDGNGVIELVVDESVRDRPSAMSQAQAELSVQQVIYTLQAATQTRAAVQFRTADNPIDQVFGVPTSEPLAEAPQLDVLALVNVTSPESGAQLSGTFTASGVASSFEANVPWEIRQGDTVLKQGFATAEGFMDKLHPWQTEPIDVSDLPAGEYTFVAMTDDPSGGEGGGPDVDTKSITIG